ncbi:C40 family peptidase [Actinoplanes sp. NPDC051494]|uniref:C40 family peptidase n=1 Tax=Actinoplanes sp. NPDC051494 TaxID=3363907 RepID=UPI0037AE9426
MKRILLGLALVFWLVLPLGAVLVAASTASASASAPCGPGGSTTQVQGVELSAEQLGNAATIVSVVRQRNLPPRAAVIAVATAMQESSLHNDLRMLDHDSIGLFQQRVQFFTARVAGDPVASTTLFLTKLVKVAGWDTRPLTDVASDVQVPRADLRGEYAKWETLAQTVADTIWPGAVTDCAYGTDDAAAGAGGPLPVGYRLPTEGQARTAVNFALQQLGDPYVFGANGPDTWDCSSLMQRAWAAADVAIPRVTTDQVRSGMPVPGLAAMRPGDLIFIAGSLGTMSSPRHVGMYIGTGDDGKQYLVQAPQSGDVVKVSPVSNWANLIAAIRRPG